MPALVRTVHCVVMFADVILDDVLSVRGQVAADGGWPRCSVFLTRKPATGNEDDGIQVIAGAGNDIIRFQGRVRRFRSSAFPKGLELVCTGDLAYADEWSPHEDLVWDPELDPPGWSSDWNPGEEVAEIGLTDQELVRSVLDMVPTLTYVSGDIAGTGVALGTESPDAFIWKAGTSAWQYIQMLDRATLYRTFQDHLGAIHRVRMIGHPDVTPDFTLAPADILDGATGERNTERTRNNVRVLGADYAEGPASGVATGATIPGVPDRWEEFASSMIESGVDPDDGTWDGRGGLRADALAAEVILDVNKEFVEASVPSWRDDLHGPGLTCQLDMLDRLAIGEPMWTYGYAWEVGDNGWTTTYTLTGGGLPRTYPPPPV